MRIERIAEYTIFAVGPGVESLLLRDAAESNRATAKTMVAFE